MLKAIMLGVGDYVGKSGLFSMAVGQVLFRALPHSRKLGLERRPGFLFASTSLRPIPRMHNTRLEAKIEQHDAVRAGSHLDFRIKMPDGSIQDFVVTRRTSFPEKTGKVYNIVRSPHHSRRYFYTNKAEFQRGEYGYGKMRTVWRGKLDVHEANENKIEFTIPEGDFRGRYCIRSGNRGWFLLKMREQDGSVYWRERMEYKSTEKAKQEAYAAGDEVFIAETKINGAHYYLVPGPKENLVISRRMGVNGQAIDRKHNIPQLRDMKFPEKYYGRKIHIEVVARDGTPSTTASVLNARPSVASDKQFSDKHVLSAVAFDIDGDGQYTVRKEDLREACRKAPKFDGRTFGDSRYRFITKRAMAPRIIRVVEDNRDTGETLSAFSARVKASGAEGVVLKKRDGKYYQDPHIKDKCVETVDLRIVGFQEGTGKHEGRLGALICEDPKTGARTKVGTGFSDQERDEIWNNRNKVNGQIVEVDTNWKIHTGSYHGPRFKGFHGDKNG